MDNKKIFDEKVKPISNVLINYYGNKYSDKINHNFDTLIYNFDDIFTTTYNTISSNPKIFKGLIEGHRNIKVKELYDKLYHKYVNMVIEIVNSSLGVDIKDKYNSFINYYFSMNNMEFIINNPIKLQEFANENNIPAESVEYIINIFLYHKIVFFHELLKINYFKDLYKRLNNNFEIFSVMVEAIFERDPFVSRYIDPNTKQQGNYLYFPYLNLLDEKNNVDIMLLHELIHLAESDSKSNRIGLFDNNNSFINEIRSDIVAKKIKGMIPNPIFDNRDNEYTSLYLKIGRPYLGFFERNDEILSDIAISGDLDRLHYYFTNNWDEFSKRLDSLFRRTYEEIELRKDDKKIVVKHDYEKVNELIKIMENEASTKVLRK